MEWQQLAFLFEGLFILTAVYAAREQIFSRIYGVRFKYWIEIDTGRHGYTILDKSLDSCKIMGQKKSIHRPNILHNIIYFVNDNTENLKLTADDYSKWSAYCNSEEFDTVMKNQMLQQLMLIMERKVIQIMFIIIIITFVAVAYVAYGQMQMKDQLTYLVQVVANYATETGITH